MGAAGALADDRSAAAAALARFADAGGDPVGALAALIDFVRPRDAREIEGSVARYTAVIELLEIDPARASDVRRHVLRLLSTRRIGMPVTRSTT